MVRLNMVSATWCGVGARRKASHKALNLNKISPIIS